MSIIHYKLPLALLATLTTASTGLCQSPAIETESAARINSANELVRAGKLDQAIEDYRQVQPAETNRDQLNYNLAVAQFRNGDVAAAKALFTQAAATSDSSLAASSRYNLGNCFYADAVKLAEQDKPAAIESLREAISHYRGSLRGNPNNADARANIELAAELISKLQAEQQQQEQQQNQDQQDQNQDQDQQNQQQQNQQQQNQDQQNQDQQNQQQQNQDQQQDQRQQDQQQQNQNQQESSEQPQSDQQQDDQQQQGEQDSESEQNQSPQNQSQSPSQPSGESNADQNQQQDAESDEQSQPGESESESPQQSAEQQSAEQQSAGSSPRQLQRRPGTDDPQQPGEPENETEQQDVPTGELTAAGQQQSDDQPTGNIAIADENAKDGLMTKQEALKMLQAVRDRDMLRRLRQEQLERSRHIPVDRDW